jgi:copper chaperone CopZ
MTQSQQPFETREYAVGGMSCEHCALSVREEVGEVDGVDAVEVELTSGRLSVRGTSLDDAAIRAAVTEAGYQVTS